MADLGKIEKDLVSCEEAIKSAYALLNFYNYGNKNDHLDKLDQLKTDLDDQLRKLRKNNFEIACVGREKAGKSSLLNAWIGFELLPNEANRCTYTTTEIRSCPDISDQKYLIVYFNEDEFEKKIKLLEKEKSGYKADLLRQEYEEIQKYKDTIYSYLGKKDKLKKFDSFNDVKDELRSAIADPGHARAVKKICIWTPELSTEENVVLYDVPGYDSPLTLHKEQTRAIIGKVDAVLFAKQFRSPDLVDSEIEILEISDSNDPYVKAKDKLVVALTNCDKANSPREYDELIIKNRKAWKAKEIPESRIVPVCSLAESNKDSPERQLALRNLGELNGGKTGFDELKHEVNELVLNSKYKIAIERSNQMKNNIIDICKTLDSAIRDKFNIAAYSEEKEKIDDSEMEKIYQEWWAQKWKSIHENFQNFFNSEIIPKISADDVARLNENDMKFKELYEKTIQKTFDDIPATKKKRQEVIYNSCIYAGIVAPKEGNTKIRQELAHDAIECLEKLTQELNKFLWRNIDKMIDWMRKELWNIPEIREEVIGKDENLANRLVMVSFDALIKRLGRPATHIFLRFPRSRVERLRVLENFELELIVIDKFFNNGKLSSRGLLQFLANGKYGNVDIALKQSNIIIKMEKDNKNDETEINEKNSNKQDSDENSNETKEKKPFFSKLKKKDKNLDENAIVDSNTVDTNAEISKPKLVNEKNEPVKNSKVQSENPYDKLDFSPDAQNLNEVQREIESDMKEFLECMKNSVFFGSGIQRFYSQELDKVRRKFIDLENEQRRWAFYVFKYVKEGNQKVKIPAPNMVDELKNRAQMAKNLNNINTIINSFTF